jgi:hypothetical protein
MRIVFAMLAALLPLCAAAFSPTGLSFSHEDWQLACDNTGTCRAAGYSADDGSEHAVSILLTRAAGARQAVSATVQIGKYGDNAAVDALPAKFSLALRINGQAYGALAFDKDSLQTDLSPQQVNALLAALPRRAVIEMRRGADKWLLSDKGAAAVLLKMDEYQGRLGTVGALVRKGDAPESGVPPAAAAPRFVAAPPPKAQPGDAQFASRNQKALMQALRAATSREDCEDLFDDSETLPLTAVRLAPSKMLVSVRCWLAAYNEGNGYWIVNDRPPFQPILVTTSGSDADGATITEGQKGRGLGDCWSSLTRGWNGKSFEVVAESSTGMCRLIAPGGAWSLPTVVTREK